jgi:hypothetical protein
MAPGPAELPLRCEVYGLRCEVYGCTFQTPETTEGLERDSMDYVAMVGHLQVSPVAERVRRPPGALHVGARDARGSGGGRRHGGRGGKASRRRLLLPWSRGAAAVDAVEPGEGPPGGPGAGVNFMSKFHFTIHHQYIVSTI